jgi:hypothetical protein
VLEVAGESRPPADGVSAISEGDAQTTRISRGGGWGFELSRSMQKRATGRPPTYNRVK